MTRLPECASWWHRWTIRRVGPGKTIRVCTRCGARDESDPRILRQAGKESNG